MAMQRAKVCCARIQELNPLATVEAISGALPTSDEFWSNVTFVCVCDQTHVACEKVLSGCRVSGVPAMFLACHGHIGGFATDLGAHSFVRSSGGGSADVGKAFKEDETAEVETVQFPALSRVLSVPNCRSLLSKRRQRNLSATTANEIAPAWCAVLSVERLLAEQGVAEPPMPEETDKLDSFVETVAGSVGDVLGDAALCDALVESDAIR
jgi:hypothetical protein